jgi:hypothetical protein
MTALFEPKIAGSLSRYLFVFAATKTTSKSFPRALFATFAPD